MDSYKEDKNAKKEARKVIRGKNKGFQNFVKTIQIRM